MEQKEHGQQYCNSDVSGAMLASYTCSEHSTMHQLVKSLCCTPETQATVSTLLKKGPHLQTDIKRKKKRERTLKRSVVRSSQASFPAVLT